MIFFFIPGLIAAYLVWTRGTKRWPDQAERAKTAFTVGVITCVVWFVILYANYAP